MTYSKAAVAHFIALILQYLNAANSLPLEAIGLGDWGVLIASLIGLFQAILGLRALRFNPEGTPAALPAKPFKLPWYVRILPGV